MKLSIAFSRLVFALAIVLSPMAAPAFAQQTSSGQAPAQAPKAESPAGLTAPSALPASVDPNKFDLGAEDVIYVRVWREPDLTGIHVVRPDGNITMPLIGEIKAAGQTPMKLASQIADQLGKEYMKDPQVTVAVQQVRSKRYYVSGEVMRPGAYPLVVPTTVFEALTLAGGFREFANKKKITIIRGAERLKFNYNDVVKGKNLSQNIEIENGDTINVP
ncbi:MAG TPA: polysaccharide biosynthesis/export family protein [Bryobacteraceae bacterium]|nr:polysaccharide biosynthesis/export family protein [Bryobacteraceae bacterium]